MQKSDFDRAEAAHYGRYIVRPESDIPETELVKGSLSHLVNTAQLTISFLKMEKHSVFNVHSHPQEQIMIVTQGSCDEIIDGRIYRVRAGDVIHLPSGIPHGAFINDEDCHAIDLFVNGRNDYIEKFRQQHSGCSLPFSW